MHNSVSTRSIVANMSPDQLKQLKDSVGQLNAMTSCVSTSNDLNVAKVFAGNSEDRSHFESLILEIIIDESQHEDTPVIFADIASASFYKAENEVLLSMGTILHIESMELDENVTTIRLRTCRYDDPVYRELRFDFQQYKSSNVHNENLALLQLGRALLFMGDRQKAQEIYHQIDPSIHPVFSDYREFGKVLARIGQIDYTDRNCSTTFRENLYKGNRITRSLIDLAEIHGVRRDNLIAQEQFLDTCIQNNSSKPVNIARFLKVCFDEVNSVRPSTLSMDPSSANDSFVNQVKRLIDMFSQNDYTSKPMQWNQFKSDMDEMFHDNHPMRIHYLLLMAWTTKEEEDYDRAMGYLRDSLLIPYTNTSHALLHKELASIYEEQQNWPATFESHENIIKMSQLATNSSTVFKAHIGCGNACVELEDYSTALLSYTNALELPFQHHPLYHSLTSQVHIKIGDLFKKSGDTDATLKSYQVVITHGCSDSVSKAYRNIRLIHTNRKDYDAARFYFVKRFEILEGQIPQNTFFLGTTHTFLARIEHKTGHLKQRDFHIEQALIIAKNDEEGSDALNEMIQFTFEKVFTTN